MLGAIFGDMTGSIYEWHNIHTKDFPMLQKRQRFTDDSVMSIAVAEALMNAKEQGMSDEKTRAELVRCMRKYGRKHPDAGYGGMFRQWLVMKDPQPYGSFGNGSAMRVSSAGWLYDTLEKTEHYAELSAEVTHNHPEGIRGAKATAAAVYLARTGSSREDIAKYITETYGYDLSEDCDSIRTHYTFDGSCQGTVPQAIRAFLEGTDYEDCIRTAVSLGGDCDTLTCICGGIAEAYFGMPEEYRESVYARLEDDLKEVCRRFEACKSAV